jgi:RNA polymerase sigma-70 factor, ECF subfamily
MRLFASPERIQNRMSATFAVAALGGSAGVAGGGGATLRATLGRLTAITSLSGSASLLFSRLAVDDTKSLAQGLRRRDPELLDGLIEQYQYRLFRYLLYITGNRERAEDFFQETWMRVLERGHQYDGKSKFESWLFAIARNLVIDWQRQRKPQSLDALTNPEEGAPVEFAGEGASPLEQILTHESETTVQTALGKMPAIYREVLLLRFQEEMQLTEIATVLDAPISTVKSRLYRGLEDLRGLLTGETA